MGELIMRCVMLVRFVLVCVVLVWLVGWIDSV